MRGKTTCMWVHLVQGHVCSSPSPSPPPPPFQMREEGQLACAPLPPCHTPLAPPWNLGQILATSPEVEDDL
jgi:hypothetical protein